MSSVRPKLSWSEYIDYYLGCLQTVFVTGLAMLTAPFRGENGNRSFSKHVKYAAVRHHLARCTAKQLQAFTPPTDEAYLDFAKAKGIEPFSTILPYNAKAHWVGNKDAVKILVFFHGGGFVKPATTHFELLWQLHKSFGSNSAACLLSYSLAPHFQYHVQLQQAVALLRYLVTEGKKNPEEIVLAGDSAGGNLVLGVLSHLTHSHPSIEQLELSNPFLGAALISPWGDFNTSSYSYTRNQYKDAIDATVLRRWSAYFMGNTKADNYNQPFHASSSWWRNLHTVVREVLIMGGADEVCIDDIANFAKTIKQVFPEVKTLIGEGEVHDQPLMGEDGGSSQETLLKEWLSARL